MFKLILLLPILIVSFFVIDEAQARTSFLGTFEGKFDEKMINTVGEFRVNNNIDTFVLTGTFENDKITFWDPYQGVYVTSNPNCQKIIGDLVLQNDKTIINLDFKGKNCKYGLTSYVIGTFETSVGEGSITFVADHHSNSVQGQLKGVLNEIPEQINHKVVINDSIKLTGEKEQ